MVFEPEKEVLPHWYEVETLQELLDVAVQYAVFPASGVPEILTVTFAAAGRSSKLLYVEAILLTSPPELIKVTRHDNALPAACLAISLVIEILLPANPAIWLKNPVLEV